MVMIIIDYDKYEGKNNNDNDEGKNDDDETLLWPWNVDDPGLRREAAIAPTLAQIIIVIICVLVRKKNCTIFRTNHCIVSPTLPPNTAHTDISATKHIFLSY